MIVRWIATGLVWVLTAVFVIAFLGETALLFWEFGPVLGLSMATFAAQQFVFFPTLGLVGVLFFRNAAELAVESAFSRWTAALSGALVVLVIVGGTANLVGGFRSADSNRSWWELSKQALEEDHGGPMCARKSEGCARDPRSIVAAHKRMGPAVREELDLSEHVDTEVASTVLTDYRELAALLPDTDVYCIASGRIESVGACERSQAGLQQRINDLYADPANRSRLGNVHEYFLMAKTAFILYILGIGLFILANHECMREVGHERIHPALRTIPVGALAMVFWPVLNQAYVTTKRAMFGLDQSGSFVEQAPIYVALTIVWAASIILFFLRLNRADAAMWTQVGTLSVTGLTVLQFDVIVRLANRFLGAGAQPAFLISAIVLIVFLSWQASMIIRASGLTDTTQKQDQAFE